VGSNPDTIYLLEEAVLDITFNERNKNEGTQMGENWAPCEIEQKKF
jgi:hypothetical protein